MRPQPETLHLPAQRNQTSLVPLGLNSRSAPGESRRFFAVVSAQRTVMAALKCRRRKFFTSDFIAEVVNESDDELACSVTGWTHGGSVALAPEHLWVSGQSVARIPITAPLRFPHRLRSIALHMQNRSLRATAEAEVPVPPALALLTAVCVLAVATLGALFAWKACVPEISAYALPMRVVAGDRVVASYAYAGMGTGEYDVTSRGEQVSGGVLSSKHGSFSFPTSNGAAFYHVTLSVVGAFGNARRQLIVQALPASAASVLSIAALQPDPSVVRSGDKIIVRYLTDAQTGTVTLFDASNIPLAHAAYDERGFSRLVAPDVDVPTQYRVELVATRGSESARASAGLLVEPKETGPAPPSNLLTASQLLHVKANVESAQTFAVRVLQHPADLRLTLEDSSGTPVQSEPVAPGTPLVYFQAPNVSHDSPYVLVASFSSGNVSQVLLRHILVRVR